jgi:hypothetical protein
MRKNITIIPPIKFPTNISGVPSDRAASDKLISGIDVSIPSKKKETAKDETLSLRDSLSIESMMNPDPTQINT